MGQTDLQLLDARIKYKDLQSTEINSIYACGFKTCELVPLSEQRLDSESWERRAIWCWDTGCISIEDHAGPTDTNRWGYRPSTDYSCHLKLCNKRLEYEYPWQNSGTDLLFFNRKIPHFGAILPFPTNFCCPVGKKPYLFFFFSCFVLMEKLLAYTEEPPVSYMQMFQILGDKLFFLRKLICYPVPWLLPWSHW